MRCVCCWVVRRLRVYSAAQSFKVVAPSGPRLTRLQQNEKTYQASEELIAHVGGGEPEELRRLPTEVIKEASHLLSGVIPEPRRVHTPAKLKWMPVNDGVILPVDSDSRPLGSVPLLLGF